MTEVEKREIHSLVDNYVPLTIRTNDFDGLDEIESAIIYNEEPYLFRYGSYKMVFIPDEEEYVIKIPFNKVQCFGRFVDIPDNCLDEIKIYERMKERGFANFFSEVTFLENYNDIPIYIQEKATTYYNTNCNRIKNCKLSGRRYKKFLKWIDKKGIDYSSSYIIDIPKSWWAAALRYYGFQKVKDFAEYILSEELDISCVCADLHGDNFGFRESDGSPCIIDFSSNSEV